MSSFLASSARSSVEGKAVRLYVSFKTLSWFASARFRFFLMIGSSVLTTGAGGGLYVGGDTLGWPLEYGEDPRPSVLDCDWWLMDVVWRVSRKSGTAGYEYESGWCWG